MVRPRVAVLRGGPSSEYEVSLKTGGAVIKNIPPDIYDVQDIFISRDGVWHKNGQPVRPHDVIFNSDVIFNALHGQYGEDGKVQHLLESHQIPFTGSGSFSSALAMNKVMAKEVFRREKIKTPQHKVFGESFDGTENMDEELMKIFRSFPLPIVVKPVSAGSSVGVTIVKDFASFEPALNKALEHSQNVMVEEYIPGVEATVGVIDGYRNMDCYVLPPIEIRPSAEKGKTFYDYEAKYGGASEKIVPGNFSYEDKARLEEIAKKVHKALGLRHYSRIDFIVNPRRGIYVLEANSLPGFTEASILPKALESVGSSLPHFLDHVLQLALQRK